MKKFLFVITFMMFWTVASETAPLSARYDGVSPRFVPYLAGYENSVKVTRTLFGVAVKNRFQLIDVNVLVKNKVAINRHAGLSVFGPRKTTKRTVVVSSRKSQPVVATKYVTANKHYRTLFIVPSRYLLYVSNVREYRPTPKAAVDKSPDGALSDSSSVGLLFGLTSVSDPYYSAQWGLSALNIEQAWRFNSGSGIVVGMVDDGIEYNHEDIAANMWTNVGEIASNGIDDDNNGYVDDYYGYSFYPDGINDVYPYPSVGHGTAVAGILGAVRDNDLGISGIAPETKLMALRVWPKNNEDPVLVYDAAVQAVNYAVDHGARVINMSICFYGPNIDYSRLDAAIDYAKDHGSIVVTAAGNYSRNFGAAPAVYPANYEGNIMTVGALEKLADGTIQRASYSDYGTNLDFVAPGSDIVSTRGQGGNYSWYNNDPTYQIGSGTSYSTPMVSGVVALLLSQNPLQSFDDIYRRLKYSATDMGTPGRDDYYGWGMVNPFKALSEDYYDSGLIKSRFIPEADTYDIIRTDYNTQGVMTNRYDKDSFRAVFEYYADMITVYRVFFYDNLSILKRTNEYYEDGQTIHYRSYSDGRTLEYNPSGILSKETLSNGNMIWYSTSGNRIKFFECSTGRTTDYLDEDYFGNKTGRISKITESDGTYIQYQSYFGSKNTARYTREYHSPVVTTEYDVFGIAIPRDAQLTYYPDTDLSGYFNPSTGIRYDYYNDDYYGNGVGRIQKMTESTGRQYLYTYTNPTDIASTRQILQDNQTLMTETYDSSGILTQRQYPSGDIRRYYSSGNLKSASKASTGELYDYLDENYYSDNTGRLSKITASDGSYLVFENYFPNSTQPASIKQFSGTNALTGTFEYDVSGNLINTVGAYGKTEVPASSSSYTSLQINNKGHMVWQGPNSTIWYFDGVSSRQVSAAGALSKNPRLNDNDQIAWQQMYSNYEIVRYDTATSTLTRITNNSFNDDTITAGYFEMDLNNQGRIVWDVEQQANVSQVYLYDGTSVTLLNESPVFKSRYPSPRFNNAGDVVWSAGNSTSGYDIYKRSGSGVPTPVKISGDLGWSHYADINNLGHVAYCGLNGNDPFGLYLYDGITIRKLSNNKINNLRPRINDKDQIAFLGGLPSPGKKEVYFYDGTSIRQVTNDGMEHTIVDINNLGYILWQRTNGTNNELFLYDGYQNRQLSSNAKTSALDEAGNVSWVDVATNKLFTFKLQPYTGSLPDLNSGAVSITRYSNGRIKSRTYADTYTEEYRNENYYGDNLGRKTMERFPPASPVVELHYLSYWGDQTPDTADDTNIVKQMDRYVGGIFDYTNNYDITGRITSVIHPADFKEVNAYYGSTTTLKTKTYYSKEATLGIETFFEDGSIQSKQDLDGNVRWYNPSGNLNKIVTVRFTGQPSFYEYHPALVMRSVIRSTDGTTWQYQDEDFYGDKQGRLSKILSFDGSYDLYQDYWTGTDQVKTIKRYDSQDTLQATYTYNQDGSLLDSQGSGTPPDFGYRLTATYHLSGRIKSRTLQDGTYVEYRDENFNGDNTGRMTLRRDSDGAEYRFLEYWGDKDPRGWFDQRGQVTTVERYTPSDPNPLVKFYLDYSEIDGRLLRMSIGSRPTMGPQPEAPAPMPPLTTTTSLSAEFNSRLEMSQQLADQSQTLSRSAPIGPQTAFTEGPRA